MEIKLRNKQLIFLLNNRNPQLKKNKLVVEYLKKKKKKLLEYFQNN